MTQLSDANSSREIELSRFFRPRTEKKDLLVLVEGDDDVYFWKLIMTYAQERYARIDIHTLKVPDTKSTDSEIDRKGKESLMEITLLGPSKIIAIDLDYDNIVESPYSNRINSDPYILHTLYYSMENHKLYPDIIKNYLSDIFREEPTFDFERRVSDFSTIIAPYLRLIILAERKQATRELNEEEEGARLSIKTFRADISKFKFSKNHFSEDAASWQSYMNGKYQDLINEHQTDLENLKNELSQKGYTESDYWKLLQGHTLQVIC